MGETGTRTIASDELIAEILECFVRSLKLSDAERKKYAAQKTKEERQNCIAKIILARYPPQEAAELLHYVDHTISSARSLP